MAVPAYSTRIDPDRPNLLGRVAEVAEQLGTPLMPWQRDFVALSTQMDDDGQFLRDTALATVPRQSGKTVVVMALLVQRLLDNPEFYGAFISNSRISAANRLKDIGSVVVRSGLDPGAKATMGVGNERLLLSNGSRLEVHTPNTIHGESVDIACIDEAWNCPESTLDGVVPAMAARPHSQMFLISTQGTLADSHLLNRFCDLGRSDPEGSIAYLEYSMPDGADLFDEEQWPGWMPALGHTVTVRKVAQGMAQLDAGQARRAYGNIATATEGEVIPAEWWEATSADAPIPSEIVVAVDASAAGASVAACYRLDGRWHVVPLLWTEKPDANWLVVSVEELRRYRPSVIAVDPGSVAGPALAGLQGLADKWVVPLRKFTARDRAQADQWLFEGLRDGRVSHSSLPALEDAVRDAVTKPTGDGSWVFDRKRSLSDVSPLVACSLAAYAAQEAEALEPVGGIF